MGRFENDLLDQISFSVCLLRLYVIFPFLCFQNSFCAETCNIYFNIMMLQVLLVYLFGSEFY
jgi:hypothetical protein